MSKNLYLAFLLISLFILSGCPADDEFLCVDAQEYTIEDLTGLDGCGLVLVDIDGQKFEPTNLNDFDLVFQDGDEIMATVEDRPDVFGICIVGPFVEIVCIE